MGRRPVLLLCVLTFSLAAAALLPPAPLQADRALGRPPTIAPMLPPGLPAALSAVEGEIRRGGETRRVRPLRTVRTADGREAVAVRVVVGFREGVSQAEREDVHRKVGARGAVVAQAVAPVGARPQAVGIMGVASLEEIERAYRADTRVQFAEPDYVRRAFLIPNDPSFGQQWGMAMIQAPTAWDVTTGSAQVTIAILDSGIYESGSSTFGPGHPDLNGKVVARRNFTPGLDPDDWVGHGTHVAGIAAANTNNGVGVAGVAPNVRLLNGKVLDDQGAGADSWISEGIRWAADSGANVINLSLGGPGPISTTLQEAINYAWSKNVVIVAAAGNDGTSEIKAPASGDHVVAVASVDPNNVRSSFSSFGSWVHVAAPGALILSTINDGGYGALSGTSMAAPHVSGLAALIWSTGRWPTAEAVARQLTGTADPVAGTGDFWQAGRVNAARAVNAISAVPPPGPTATPTPTAAPTPIATAAPTGP